jgi:predicted RNase H-like HicB family nuclease
LARVPAGARGARCGNLGGYTRDEALQNIREVLEMIVAELVEEGRPVPANVSVSEDPLVAITV